MVLTDDNFVSIAKPSRKAGSSSTTSAFDKGEPDVLDRPPRRRAEGIVNRVLWERTVLTGMTMAVGSLWLFRWAMDAGLT